MILKKIHFLYLSFQEQKTKSKSATPPSDDVADEISSSQFPLKNIVRNRRGAVSAEVYKEEDAAQYVKKVIQPNHSRYLSNTPPSQYIYMYIHCTYIIVYR